MENLFKDKWWFSPIAAAQMGLPDLNALLLLLVWNSIPQEDAIFFLFHFVIFFLSLYQIEQCLRKLLFAHDILLFFDP